MKELLTPERMEQRKKNNKIVLIYIILPIIVLTMINRFIPSKQNVAIEKTIIPEKRVNIDSIVTLVKNDTLFKVKSIFYNINDSTLRIELIKKQDINVARYFDIEYNLMSVGVFSEIEVYCNNKVQSTFGLHTARDFDRFKREFVAGWDGSCRPVTKYIKSVMNDPASFDHEQTFITPLLNGNYEVKTIFRGKNGFGALVLNSSFAEVSPSGNVLSFKIE